MLTKALAPAPAPAPAKALFPGPGGGRFQSSALAKNLVPVDLYPLYYVDLF